MNAHLRFGITVCFVCVCVAAIDYRYVSNKHVLVSVSVNQHNCEYNQTPSTPAPLSGRNTRGWLRGRGVGATVRCGSSCDRVQPVYGLSYRTMTGPNRWGRHEVGG